MANTPLPVKVWEVTISLGMPGRLDKWFVGVGRATPLGEQSPLASQKPRRRWIRFRLRTQFIAGTLMAVPFAWVDWNLEQIRREQKAITQIEGLKQYALYARLPTHNSTNDYFRRRMNSYMLQWLYGKDKDIALVNKAIEIARRAIAYRNDNICQVDDQYTSYEL